MGVIGVSFGAMSVMIIQCLLEMIAVKRLEKLTSINKKVSSETINGIKNKGKLNDTK